MAANAYSYAAGKGKQAARSTAVKDATTMFMDQYSKAQDIQMKRQKMLLEAGEAAAKAPFKRALQEAQIRNAAAQLPLAEQDALLRQANLGRIQAPATVQNQQTGVAPQQVPQVQGQAPQAPQMQQGGNFAYDPRLSSKANMDVVEDIIKEDALRAGKMETERQKSDIAVEESVTKKWNDEGAQRQINFDVMTPKLQNYMELGSRAYKELQGVAKEFGIDLNFEKGGFEALKAAAFKNAAVKLKMAPLMTALKNLTPELGVELMRQLGAFRSGQMAQKFTETLAQFSGDIREDIANMSSTLVKNKANVVLLDEQGNRVPEAVKEEKMNTFEADLIRKYNTMYRGMGLMTKAYTAGRDFKWLAEHANFNEKEQEIIQQVIDTNPGYDEMQVAAKLIEKGIL